MKTLVVVAAVVIASPAAAESLLVGPEGQGAILAGGTLREATSGVVLAEGIGSAAFTDDGILWVVAGNKLGWIDAGRFDAELALPAEGCRLAAGAGRLVLACPHGEGEDDLFVLEGDGGYRYLFTVDSIEAMSVTRAGVLLSSRGAIVHYRPGEGAIVEPVAAVSGAVDSLCVDQAAPVLYVLVGGRAQALVDGRAVPLADGVSDLACRGGDLYLLRTDGTVRVLPAAGRALAEKAKEEVSS